MKKILITGGAGFIGSHLAKRLLNEGHEVTILDNLFTGNKSNIYDILDNPKFTFIIHDVTQPFWGQYDEIYNLACPASPIHYQRNPVETIKASILGITNMLELALKTKAKVLHASTSEIYGDPLEHPQKESYWGNVNTVGIRSCYDEGKRAAETLCSDYYREYGVDVRAVRIFNTYGPNMHPADGRVVSNFIMQALNNQDITIYGSGKQTRSFQYVDDLVEAMIRFMNKDKKVLRKEFDKLKWESFPVLNTGNPDEFSMLELAKKVLKQVPQSKSKIKFKPLPKDDPQQRKPNISRAKKIIKWQPKVKLDKGLSKTIEYFRKINQELIANEKKVRANIESNVPQFDSNGFVQIKDPDEKVLSIIIPIYNEVNSLGKLLRKVENVDLSILGNIKKEIILVDDYSTDGTRDLLKKLAKTGKYKVILKGRNKGKGHTVKLGLKHATGDYNIVQDADLEYDPQDFVRLLRPIMKGKYQVVYGSRFLRRESWKGVGSHKFGNQMLSLITSILFLRKITDMETCYKCFTRKAKKRLLEKMKFNPKRFDMEPEITAKFIKLGYKIKELPINYYPRDFSEGKKIDWKDGVKALYYITKYRFVN